MSRLITPTVWIVDDDEDDQAFLQLAFLDRQPPIAVLALNDGDELLPTLNGCDQLPRLILLDVNMPRKDGFETLKELRDVVDYADLPVIMLSTSSAKTDQERALALGANRFLTKPYTYDQTRLLVQELNQQWALS